MNEVEQKWREFRSAMPPVELPEIFTSPIKRYGDPEPVVASAPKVRNWKIHLGPRNTCNRRYEVPAEHDAREQRKPKRGEVPMKSFLQMEAERHHVSVGTVHAWLTKQGRYVGARIRRVTAKCVLVRWGGEMRA